MRSNSNRSEHGVERVEVVRDAIERKNCPAIVLMNPATPALKPKKAMPRARICGATRLARRAHRGPYVIQRPFFPEGRGVCHVYLLHPPGGLVGGDELQLDLRVGPAAHTLVTTPAAGKAYRTHGPGIAPVARAGRRGRRDAGVAALEETIVYDGASVELETRVELAPDARFFGAETLCFGLPARRAPFARGSCRQSFELRRDGAPISD